MECGAWNELFCAACLQGYQPRQAQFGPLSVTSAGPYRSGLRRAVLRLKEHNDRRLTRLMGEWMSRLLTPESGDWLVPVPTSGRRRRWRGYCAPQRLAGAIAEHTGIAVWTGLECLGDPLARKTLRGSRGRSASELSYRSAPISGRIVLIDDVVTSGYTLQRATAALLAAGADEVRALTLAG